MSSSPKFSRRRFGAALTAGGVPPERVGYFEAHGTGTILGDHARNARADAIIGRYDPDGVFA